MKIALVVPGGVDRSGEFRVIPALLALIERLSRHNELHVFALFQEIEPGTWPLLGACIHNTGRAHTLQRTIRSIRDEHRIGRFDLIHSIWSGRPGLVAVIAAKLLHLPSLVHVAGGELVALDEIHYGGRLGWLGRAREAMVLQRASAVTAASAPMINSLARLGITAQRLPLGVDLKCWPPCPAACRDPQGTARLIHIASLNRVKDQTTLIHALRALRDAGVKFRMDIVGEDTLDGEIQALANHLGLNDYVHFHGFLTQRALIPLLQKAHLLVVSSRHEAGPLVVFEAAALGVPTVGTVVGHVAELAPSAACSVPVGDRSELARAIGMVLNDERLRLHLARNAQRIALRDDADSTAQGFQAIYAQLILRGNGRP